MKAHVGDRIVLESEKAGPPSREGVSEEVLQGRRTPRLLLLAHRKR